MQTIYWNLQADNETEILKAAGRIKAGRSSCFSYGNCVWAGC